MILYRSASVLHSYGIPSTSKLLSQFKHSYSYSSLRSPLIWINQSNQRIIRKFSSSSAATAAVPEKKGKETFFADESTSWDSLGLSDRVSQALSTAGFDRPSLVQAACIPSILSGKDVVIAAETGSGKTHSYLVPLINKICGASSSISSSPDEQAAKPQRGVCLVLCPNVLLCEQVVRMANGLNGDDGEPLVKALAACGRQGWPVKEPDVIVSTPAALLNSIDPKTHHRSNFIRRVQYVVFDEADMLLCGSFQNQVIRLLNMLRFDEKVLSRARASGPDDTADLNPDSLAHLDLGDDVNIENESVSDGGEDFEDDVDVDVEDLAEGSEAVPAKKKGWRRVRKPYARSKQYVFVAATLPVNGKKTAGAVLKKMFPDAIWITGNYLHCQNPRLEERWIEVTFDTQVDALIDAVKQFRDKGLDSEGSVSRTMVFANTVEAVEAVAKILERTGIQCYRYHKELSLEDRAKTLDYFQENGGLFICTDAAARGVDIPNISHVIQADFATSAVDFLHRIGRTARAGQYGLVTSLYTESNQDLVDAIRRAWKSGQPVETAFSRKRSFRNKLKKKANSSKVGDSAIEYAQA